MEESFKKLEIACPSCGIIKTLKIPISIFSEKKAGFIKIQVPKGAVCNDHLFMVLVDQKAKILGYETFDVSISKPEEKVEEKVEENKEIYKNGSTLRSLIEIYGFNCVAGLIHAKLFGYSAFLISSLDSNADISTLKEFVYTIIPEKYRNSYAIDKIEYDGETFPRPGYYYNLAANKQKNDFLFNLLKHVIQAPWETGFEFEQNIINNALRKEENGAQFKTIKEFLDRFIKDIDLATSILENSNKISEKDLIKKMNEQLTFSSINKHRIKIIKEFINRRISPSLVAKIK